MSPRELVEELAEDSVELTLLHGELSDALIGVQQTFESRGIRYRALYSVKKCAEILMADGASYESVMEYLNFNTLGAYVGDSTPSFLLDLEMG